MKFDKDFLAVEQKNYFGKIAMFYIVCDLDFYPRNPTNIFKFKNCLFWESNIVKKIDKEKYVYSGYGRAFDSTDSWSFANDTAIR